MSKPPPGPAQILRSLARIREFAAQEAARRVQSIEAAAQRERLALRRQESAVKASDDQRAADQDQAQRDLDAAIEEAHARARHRTAAIRQAQVAVRKAAAQRAEAEEGKRKFEVQREMLRATRERDAGLASAKADFEAFGAALEIQRTRLNLLEAEARTLFATSGPRVRNALARAHETTTADLGPSEDVLHARLATTLDAAETDIAAFRRLALPALSRAWPITLLIVLSPVAIVPVLPNLGVGGLTWRELALGAAGLAVVAVALHLVGRRRALPAALRIVEAIGAARVLVHACGEKSAATHGTRAATLAAAFEEVSRRCHDAWNELAAWLERNRGALPARVDARATQALARNDAYLQARLAKLRENHRRHVDDLLSRHRNDAAEALRQTEIARETIARERTATERDSAERWTSEGLPVLDELEAFHRGTATTIGPPPWFPPENWAPPAALAPAVPFGRLDIDPARLIADLPAIPPGSRSDSGPWRLPLLLRFPMQGSLVLETDASRRSLAIGTLNLLVCRLLAASPPGRVAFTVFDPVGLGQSFSGLTHLADEAEHLIHGRIWTQSAQIEEKLADLNDHLEKVIQMYLRNDFPTIAEYNEQAGNIAEKYRVVVLADFPAGFTDLALRRLQSIASAGARCGVFLWIHRDTGVNLPADFSIQTFRSSAVHVRWDPTTPDGPPKIDDLTVPLGDLRIDPPADTPRVTDFIHRVARANRDSNRVEVPFEFIAPDDSEIWSLDTAAEIRVPIGRTGATKLQYLALGKGTRQHALIAGKTGSGKSTLFHVLVTNLSLWCRPDQIEFYLVDFKKGVEFKCYATHRLPHARVVAIESDRDFGLGVLQRLDEELRRRGEWFRSAEVQDIAAYRGTPNARPMPRILLLVDEFQEFFVEEDRIAQNASVLLDRIVRQGRAFGIHVILGSQTLGGAYTAARTTLGQMAVRIALQCNEADAFLIMDEENPAPRLLSRPGEAIYNDAAGHRTGNSPFQIVWLSDDARDSYLQRVRRKADQRVPPCPGPLVFEGDAPADIRENLALRDTLRTRPTSPPAIARTWLGAPNSIKEPTEVGFSRRSGDHLLVVGQRDDTLLALLGIALASLSAQFPTGAAEFVVLDGSAPGAPDQAYLDSLRARIPHPLSIVRPGASGDAIRALGAAMRLGSEAGAAAPAPTRFLFVHRLQQFRDLRQDDDFGFASSDGPPPPAAVFKELISDGPPLGVHVLASCDTYTNVVRFLGRKGLTEFGYRVLFQMSANDSASLIDNPAASRLGLHRALLYLDREGHFEVFRPYALPDPASLQPVDGSGS